MIYLRYTATLFDVFSLFFTAVLSKLHEKPRMQDSVAEKTT